MRIAVPEKIWAEAGFPPASAQARIEFREPHTRSTRLSCAPHRGGNAAICRRVTLIPF